MLKRNPKTHNDRYKQKYIQRKKNDEYLLNSDSEKDRNRKRKEKKLIINQIVICQIYRGPKKILL